MTKWIIFIFLLPIAFLDALTTYLSIDHVTRHKILSLLFTILINGTLFLAFIQFKRDNILWFLGTLIWFTAFTLDLVSNFYWDMASKQYPSTEHFIFLALAALLMTGSTITSSYFVFRDGIFKFNR